MHFLWETFIGKEIDVLFQNIDTASTYLNRHKSDGWKINVLLNEKMLTLFWFIFRWKYDEWKTDAASMCWFWCVCERERTIVILKFIFDKLFMGQRLKSFQCLFFNVAMPFPYFFYLFFRPDFSWVLWNSEQKNVLQTMEQLTRF